MTERPPCSERIDSVYVRIVRLVLAEKRSLRTRPVASSLPRGRQRTTRGHPSVRIPAFDHAGFRLYETAR